MITRILRFIGIVSMAAAIFIAGVIVGRVVMPRKIEIVVVDVQQLVDIIEKYHKEKQELERMRFWNDKTIIKLDPEEEDDEIQK